MLLANHRLILLLNLAFFTLFITPLNNQEVTNTKNPMAQVRLEFQMLRAKQNLISPNLTEKITLTAKNSPTLYREISKIAQAFNILTPTITISELEHQQTSYKHWAILYDHPENTLTIGKNLLEQLTMPELGNLIASEISYNICMADNSTGMNILKVISLNLIFSIPISIILYGVTSALLKSSVSALFIPYVLLMPFMFPNLATKEVLQCSATLQLLMSLLFILPMLTVAFLTDPIFMMLNIVGFSGTAGLISLITVILNPICTWIASTYAKSHLELAIDKLSYLPNAELLNSAINKIETNNKIKRYRSQSKLLLKSWLKHRKFFANALAKQNLNSQKLAAQSAAIDGLVKLSEKTS